MWRLVGHRRLDLNTQEEGLFGNIDIGKCACGELRLLTSWLLVRSLFEQNELKLTDFSWPSCRFKLVYWTPSFTFAAHNSLYIVSKVYISWWFQKIFERIPAEQCAAKRTSSPSIGRLFQCWMSSLTDPFSGAMFVGHPHIHFSWSLIGHFGLYIEHRKMFLNNVSAWEFWSEKLLFHFFPV